MSTRESPTALLERFRAELVAVRAFVAPVEGHTLRFERGLVRPLNDSRVGLGMIWGGSVVVDPGAGRTAVSLEANFGPNVLIVTCMVAFIPVALHFMEPGWGTFPGISPILLGIMWLWLFFANYFSTVSRLKSWTKRILEESELGAPHPVARRIELPYFPDLLRSMEWRWKIPVLVFSVAVPWNLLCGIVFMNQGAFPRFVKNPAFMVLNAVLGFFITYACGRSIDRYNASLENPPV